MKEKAKRGKKKWMERDEKEEEDKFKTKNSIDFRMKQTTDVASRLGQHNSCRKTILLYLNTTEAES